MALSRARQRFIKATRVPDDDIDLERAALYIAQEAYPELAVEQFVEQLDKMADVVLQRLPEEAYPLRVMKAISEYLFGELGFSGNQLDYYNPQNSFLNDVLTRRSGIPITLSLVYLGIARRLDFAMVGIGMPGHFLIRPTQGEMDLFVDPFNGGEVLFLADCQERFQSLFGEQLPLRPEFLAPVSNRQVLARILTNLKAIYLHLGELDPLLAAIDRILILFPEAPIELRDRGLLYFRCNRWVESQQDLERYLAVKPDAPDRPAIRGLLDRIGQTPRDS
jgi:regulator of sirC expression with transglutaminase-like and TPR domain